MEHYNPILGSDTSGQKFITCGEIMLRLTPPNYEKIRMASSFEASYGGSEANIALALANLGVDSTFFSVVPNNSLGKSAVRWLRSNDVHCTPMILTEPDETPSNRLGTYYLETGYGIRASKVIYDRKHSVITEYDFSQVDLDALLDGFDWLHLSGITPALAPNCRGLIIDMLKTAKKKGLTVSFDGNFRSTLWSWEEARDFCTECLPYVDVLLGIEPYHLWKDETDHSKGDWKDGVPLQPSYEQQDEIFQHFIARYPNLKCIARHVRVFHDLLHGAVGNGVRQLRGHHAAHAIGVGIGVGDGAGHTLLHHPLGALGQGVVHHPAAAVAHGQLHRPLAGHLRPEIDGWLIPRQVDEHHLILGGLHMQPVEQMVHRFAAGLHGAGLLLAGHGDVVTMLQQQLGLLGVVVHPGLQNAEALVPA